MPTVNLWTTMRKPKAIKSISHIFKSHKIFSRGFKYTPLPEKYKHHKGLIYRVWGSRGFILTPMIL